MPSSSARKIKGGRSGRSQLRIVQTLDPIQALDRSLAKRSDLTVVKGKCLRFLTFPATTITFVSLSPTFFGERIVALAAQFTRWRIRKITMTPLTASFSTIPNTGTVVVGFVDDADSSITTSNDVFCLRCSSTVSASQISTDSGAKVLQWTPVDPSCWYYTSNFTGSDPRLQVPATLAGFNTNAATNFNVEYGVWYTIEFEGATEVPGGSG
jgi:hypothetical protein